MGEIDKARWATISTLLDELLEASAAQRAARLAELRSQDPLLAEHVAGLLAQQGPVANEQFLEGTAFDPLGLTTLAGRIIGDYRLERPLGQGGMGSVWLAQRSDGRFEGQAAVKLLNLGLLGRGGAERLRHEANALARLAHANITHLIDAGVVAGQPYLVLEYVEGQPIDSWCDAQRLDVAARVRLYLQVLAAVSHAHSRMILHRDLKPSNILVTADGRAKLLDFGIAKLLEGEGQTGAPSELTRLGGPLTPSYAAPEQLQRSEVSTATDVYALGVLLYQLLSGRHPTASATDGPAEQLRALLEREPMGLSEAAANADDELARARRATPLQLARVLRGDLENILTKALKKSPAERYETVDAFASDLQRYLNHEPVNARPDSAAYRLRKFVRRHRLMVAAASVTALALVAGIAGTAWQAHEARLQRAQALEQRDRARNLLSRSEAIIDFVDMMLTEELSAGEAPAIQRMLERSEQIVQRGFAQQPAQQAQVLNLLASYYNVANAPAKQSELTERAMRLVASTNDPSLKAEIACAHASALGYTGHHEDANRMLDEWIRNTHVEANIAAVCLQSRARIAQQLTDSKAAVRFAEAGLERLRAADPPNRKIEASLLGDLGFAYHLEGKNREADRRYREAFERLRALGREESHYVRLMIVDWALVRYAMGDFHGGLELLDRSVEIARRAQGDVPIPPAVLANRAFGLEVVGRYQEALRSYEQAHDAAQRTGFPAGEAYAYIGQASVFIAMGDLTNARKRLDLAEPVVRTMPESHAVRIRATMVGASLDAARGELHAARNAFSHVIDLMSKNDLVHPALANAHRQRAGIELQQGEREQAQSDAERALDLATKLQGDNEHSDITGLAWLTLGRVLQNAGERERARSAFKQAEVNLTSTVGGEHPDTQLARRLQAAE